MSTIMLEAPRVETLSISSDTLILELRDGRAVSVPLAWYPRLLNGSKKERGNWRLIGKGSGIHWVDLDEDISVEGVLSGRPSGESQESFGKWLGRRAAKHEVR